MADALLWGLVVGSASLIGALVGYYARMSHRAIGVVLGFGSGALISALAYDLIEESFRQGGFVPVSVGFDSSGDIEVRPLKGAKLHASDEVIIGATTRASG